MENPNGSNTSDFAFMGKQSPLPPRNPLCISPPSSDYIPRSVIESQIQGPVYHQRAASDSLLIEEQPAWLDELLSEPESPVATKGHRLTASDSAAYLNRAVMPFREDNKQKGHYSAGPAWVFQSVDHHDDIWQSNSSYKYQDRGWEMPTKKCINLHKSGSSSTVHKLGNLPSKPTVNQVREGKEGSSMKSDGSQASSVSRNNSKRAKQQNAHRARVRRLQYISELERNVQMLQVEGSEVSSAIQYFDHQIIMLSMENRALNQRLYSLTHVQKLKQMEQDILEREIGRLRCLHQQQKQMQQQQQLQQQQQQMQLQQQTQYTYHQPNSRDLEFQFATLAI